MDTLTDRVREFVKKVLETFGGDPVTIEALDDLQLMKIMEKIMIDCKISFTSFIGG